MLPYIIMHIPDAIGISGVLLLLFAYHKINTHQLTANDIAYQVLNFVGSALILVSLFFNWNTAAAFIEVAWMIISLLGMRRILRQRQADQNKKE